MIKEITINIEATNERELFRRLVKAKYLLGKYFEDERRRNIKPTFSNFDICSEKVQVIIKDKKGQYEKTNIRTNLVS